jgi:putative ABC transport system permease protein
MHVLGLAWKEIAHRRASLVSGLVAITLGIAVIVGIRSVAEASKLAVAVKLDSLGANVLVLPQGATVTDYHAADIDAPTIPEEYVERIVTSALLGVENISPKLTRRVPMDGEIVVLTGILPANEVASKPTWQLEGVDGEPVTHVCAGSRGENADDRLQRKTVEVLGADEVLVGAGVSAALGYRPGHTVPVGSLSLKVREVLPPTGTVDDDRVFMHLHAMQDELKIGRQVSAIEIMGCCSAISDGMLSKLRNVLPDTRVTGISQIVSTQIETNRLMDRASWAFLGIVLLVGGLSIGNFMWANVNQRRREIGILRLVGASRSRILAVLLAKAVVLGLLGGLLGWLAGTAAVVVLGPDVLGLSVRALPAWLPLSLGLATAVAVLGSLLPALLASRFDPSANLQEV